MHFIQDIMRVAFVLVPVVDLLTYSLKSQGLGKRARLRSTCLFSSSCSYLGSKGGGPHAVLGLRGEAIHA